MSKLTESMKEKENDIRLLNRAVMKGQMTEAELAKRGMQLPDESENACFTDVEALLNEIKNRRKR
jgi:hypothetical protein